MSAHCVRSLGAVWLLVFLSGCASKEPLKVTLEQNPTALAGHYSTYAWRSVPPDGASGLPIEAMRRDGFIRSTVDRLLREKGYTLSAEHPGFLVDYEFAEKQKETSSIPEYIDYYRSGGSKGLIDAYTMGYFEGTVLLGIFDASTQQLIWRTSAKVLADQKDSNAFIADAVRQMLARWPNR